MIGIGYGLNRSVVRTYFECLDVDVLRHGSLKVGNGIILAVRMILRNIADKHKFIFRPRFMFIGDINNGCFCILCLDQCLRICFFDGCNCYTNSGTTVGSAYELGSDIRYTM